MYLVLLKLTWFSMYMYFLYEIRIIAFDRSKLGKFRYVICDKSLYGWEDYASYN